MVGLLLGCAIGVIGVILTILNVLDGGSWLNSSNILGIILAIIGIVMINIFAKKSNSLHTS